MNIAKWDQFKWDPFKELQDMSHRLNRFFGAPAPRTDAGREPLTVADWAPSVDISESGGEYVIKAEIPEVKKEDVKVTLEDGLLTIQGERKQEKEEKGKRFHRIERSYGSFLRSFEVPANVDADKIKADFKEGMLTLTLPKSEKAKPKALEVRIS
jgi:HSP20 family protein